MNIKQVVSHSLPGFIKNKILSIRESSYVREFNSHERLDCVADNLRSSKGFSLSEIFESEEINDFWENSKREIDAFRIPDGTGGVNPGDRRALYSLISKLRPSSVLEIGTHIGASNLHIASALYISQIKNGSKASMTTLDIRDVNSVSERPWLDFGSKYSPIEMTNKLNYGSFVEYATDSSLNFFANCQKTFDFIFLDGGHSSTTVYQEIPSALKVLKKNGVILLHDYFPLMKPLWSNGPVIEGPYMATERLINEGADLVVLPLGSLPWPTKHHSNVTSLALLMRNS